SDPNGTNINRWVVQDTVVHGGTGAWRVGDAFLISEHFLESTTNFIITGDQPVYRFYTYYNTEIGKDGGFLEISTDQQAGWAKLEDKIFRNGYPRKLEYNTFAIPNLGAYSGLSDSSKVFQPVYVDLSDYAGQAATIRYRFGTNEGIGDEGWYIDDVELMDAVIYNAQACIISDQTTTYCTEAPERGTIVDSQMMIGTKDEEGNTSFVVMPNPAGDFVQIVMTAEYADQATISVYNSTGQQILSELWSLTSGVNQKRIDVAHLTDGIYILQVNTDRGMKSNLLILN
ncbi:MAG TPA: T9SS type A sorting domain-containing protein, partial [Nitrososphaeraceae archaeon]